MIFLKFAFSKIYNNKNISLANDPKKTNFQMLYYTLGHIILKPIAKVRENRNFKDILQSESRI